jgi:16S rRNA (uracil1498-N3)-methyltransferase
MTRRRWIADEVAGDRAALTGDHAAHLVRVLRAQVGQEFDIACGSAVRNGRIVSVADHRVEFELGAEIPAATLAEIILLLSIFKFDRMEWAIEKCVELGVVRIVPVIARRTDSHLAAAAMKRVDRWRRIALQAAEQCRRAATPDIEGPVKLTDVLLRPSSEGTGAEVPVRIVLSEVEQQVHLRDLLEPASSRNLILAIGPEGGWTEDELVHFREAGWSSASLGPTILRAETAATAAIAISISELSP